MKMLIGAAAIVMTVAAGAGGAPARPLSLSTHDDELVQLAGNTSSNSSSNTSSNQSNGRSTIVHTHSWSVQMDGRRGVRERRYYRRYHPAPRRYRSRRDRDDD